MCVGCVTPITNAELQDDRQFTKTNAEVDLVEVKLSSEILALLRNALQIEEGAGTAEELKQLNQLVCENADVFALDDSELGGHTGCRPTSCEPRA